MSTRILHSLTICGALAMLVLQAGARAQPRSSSSILVVNGTVVDGTGSPARRAAVRIDGDAIAEVGDRLSARPGERVIDAAGLVVAPGFIDMHSHAGRQLGERPDAESQVRQGITTTLVGQDGDSDLPVADFHESIDRLHPAINVATSVGAGTVRGLVMGGDFRRAATPAEVEVMKALVDRAMKDGAIGLSSGLEYDPGFYATPGEMAALASVVARYGGFYSSHVRDEEREVFAAWREAIEVGRRAGVPVVISHIKVAVKPVWGTAAEGLRLLEDARRAGVRVMADWYPYTYWQSSMYVLIPDRDFENREQWRVGLEEIGGAANVLVTSYRPDPSFNGRTLEEIALAQGKDPVTLVIDMIRAAGPNIGIIGTSMDERDLETFVKHPQVLVCSDGEIAGRHPRGFGTFPRVIARYVRDLKALTIEEAVAKMTGRSAAQAGLADRGIVAAGRKADLVVFDAETIADRATKQDPTRLSVGVRYVLVNGQVVLDDGKTTGARPGRGLRRTNTERTRN
jgi:N-acyl-D-amino-acid deacylase